MRSVAAQCAALYPRYGERGWNLARGSAAAGQMGRAWLEIAAIAPEKNPMGGRVFSGFWRSAVAAGLMAALMAALTAVAAAQAQSLVGPQTTTVPGPALGGTGLPGATIVTPTPPPSVPTPRPLPPPPGSRRWPRPGRRSRPAMFSSWLPPATAKTRRRSAPGSFGASMRQGRIHPAIFG